MCRLPVITGSSAAIVAFVVGASCLFAADKLKIPGTVKSKVPKAVAKLVSGEISPDDTNEREQIFGEIDKLLAKDKKHATLKTPAFWVDAMKAASSKNRAKAAPRNRIVTEDLDFFYADDSPGKAPIVFRNGALANAVPPLLVTVLPKGTDAKAWLEANWAADDTAKKGWVLAAVVESDTFPVTKQPVLIANAFGHMSLAYKTDPNRWFLEGVGDGCVAAQEAASREMPDRLAGLVLRNPKTALVNVNSKLFSTYVLDEGAAAAVGKAYTDLDAEHNVVAATGETAIADLAAWIAGHTGRTLPSSYDFVTATNEKRIVAPWTGSVFLISPAKRGDEMAFSVKYDRDAGVIALSGTNLGEFVVYMNDDLVDLDRPVTITCNGEQRISKVFERGLKEIFDTADTFGEYGRVFMAQYRGFAPSDVGADAGDGAAAAGGDAGAGDAGAGGGDGKKDGK